MPVSPHATPSAAVTALTLFPSETLLSALAHEVANHLTATRMHAELLQLGQDATSSSDAVLRTAGRAGALTACISPLSHPPPCERRCMNTLELIDQVRERISTSYDAHFPLSVLSCHVMRSARGDLEECVRALTLLAIELSCEAGNAPVSLGTNAGIDRMEIYLSVPMHRAPTIRAGQPGTGVGLALHIAEAIARRQQGWVSLRSLPDTQTCALWLPASVQ